MKKKINSIWKRALLFSFLLKLNSLFGQVILRNSDGQTFDFIEISQNNKPGIIFKDLDIHKFSFTSNDKVIYQNKKYDFTIYNDTLVFFDKVREIDEVKIVSENGFGKKNKIIKSSKGIGVAEIFKNGFTGTFVKINTTKKTYIKSIILFPQKGMSFSGRFEGILDIQILGNKNGFPDNNSEILFFSKNISEIILDKYGNAKKWELVLPKIIKYPTDGFFIVLNLKTNEKNSIGLELNKDSQMYMYYPSEGWKKLNNNSYQYKLKILQ